MDIKTETTKSLHDKLKTISTTNNLILKGMFPGVAFLEIQSSVEWLKTVYDQYFEEFRNRDDADIYEPNIKKIGLTEIVGA